jgi:hypothetical protein
MDCKVRDFNQVYIIYFTISLTRGTEGDCNNETEVIPSAKYASKRIHPQLKYK